MAKRQAKRYVALLERLSALGVAPDDTEALLRIERVLRRWAARECNGEIETEDEGPGGRSADGSRLAFAVMDRGEGEPRRWRIPNREAGALRRLAAIMARYPALGAYHQTDPRGCALYLFERARLKEYSDRQSERAHGQLASTPERAIESCYSTIGVGVTVD